MVQYGGRQRRHYGPRDVRQNYQNHRDGHHQYDQGQIQQQEWRPRSKKEEEEYMRKIGADPKTGLTPGITKLFEARHVEFKPTAEKKGPRPLTGLAQFVSAFAEPSEPEYSPEPVPIVSLAEKRAQKTAALKEKGAKQVAKELPKYDPEKDPKVKGDPYKTLFVSNLSYETSERALLRVFERYGTVRRLIRLVTNKITGLPRGYAFVEFKHTADMKDAFRRADGTKINNRRILVDVERGRTVKSWIPRRLGGGLGDSRTSKVREELPKKKRRKNRRRVRMQLRRGGGGARARSSSGEPEPRRRRMS